MTQRYCTNCGAELTEDARFCPSCGSPAHESAAVSTPEADVPVPPLPDQDQARGFAPPSQQAGEPPRRSTANKLLLFGCLGVGLVLVLAVLAGGLGLVAVIGGSGGSEEGSGGGSGKKAVSGADKNLERGEEVGSAEKPNRQENPEPAPAPPPAPEPIQLSGTGSQASKFFELEEGLTVIDMVHQGQTNFIVSLLDEQGREVSYALANDIGAVEVSNAVHIAKAGRYILDITADGPWQMTIRQPRPADAPEVNSFSGKGSAATELFSMSSGLKRINFTHQGEANFIVSLLDEEGREVEFALANEIGNVQTSSTATILEDGIYLFQVQADGPWTIDVQ